jgi:hypothetical protein
MAAGSNGTVNEVEVPRHSFHNMVERNGEWFHVIPEAVIEDEATGTSKINMCSTCLRSWDKSAAPNVNAIAPGGVDLFDDLFHLSQPGAPPKSIAAGADYGRVNFLAEEYNVALPGLLEMLVLAKSRLHSVIVKIVAHGRESKAERLTGHTLIFPHSPEVGEQPALSADVIRAALRSAEVRFVGPKGSQTKLEQAALKVRDLQLRPEVLYNFIMLRSVLTGGDAPPPLTTVRSWLDEAETKKAMPIPNARLIEDDTVAASVERASKASDVAGVRTSATDRSDEAAGDVADSGTAADTGSAASLGADTSDMDEPEPDIVLSTE